MVINSISIILISTFVAIFIGYLWYSPFLFGNQWLKLVGMNKKEADKLHKKNMSSKMLVMVLSLLILSTVLFYCSFYSTNLFNSLVVGFLLWLGLIATTMINPVLWEGKPLKLYFLNSFYYLFNIEVIVIIQTLLK